MKRLFKWIFRLVAISVVVVTALGFARNLLVRLALESRLPAATGFETTVGKVQVHLTRPEIRLAHVRLFNPARLGGKPFVDVIEARITYDLRELLARRFKVLELQVLVDDVRFVRQDPGLSTQAILARSRHQAKPLPAALVAPLDFAGVERLALTVKRYSYSDFFQMTRSQDLPLNLSGVVATNLLQPADWDALWQRLAEDKGIRPPPIQPTAPATNAPTGLP